FHVVEIFHRSLFAGRDDEALLAVHQWDLCYLLDGNEALVVLRSGADVDESAQAVVLAEMATRVFVARCAVFDLADSVEADERRLQAVAPQTERFLGGADCA